MQDVLKIRLERPACPDLVLIDGGDEPFVGSRRPCRPIEILKVGVQRLGPRRYPSITDRKSKFILLPFVAETDKFDSGVGIKINQVAIGRTVGGSCEHADAAIGILADAIKLLLENRIDAEVAGERGPHATGSGVRQRKPGGAEALVGEVSEMTPAADLEFAGETRIAFL